MIHMEYGLHKLYNNGIICTIEEEKHNKKDRKISQGHNKNKTLK